MRHQRVAPPRAVQENHGAVTAARCMGLVAVTGFVAEACRVDVMALGGSHPALFREHDGHRLGRDQLCFIKRLGLFPWGLDDGAPLVSVFFHVRPDFFGDEITQFFRTRQHGLQPLALVFQFGLLPADTHFFQLGKMAQLEFQDGLCLAIRETEAGHEHGFGFILIADNGDHFINIEKCNQQTVKNVQAIHDLVQTVLQSPGHGIAPVGQPFHQHLAQIAYGRPAVETNAVQVDADGLFQLGRSKEVRHEGIRIHPIGAHDNHQARGVLVIRLIPQIHHHGQLFGLHLLGNLLQYLVSGDLIGQLVDDDVLSLHLIAGTNAHAAPPGFVDLLQFLATGHNLSAGREVRCLHMGHELIHGGFRMRQQVQAGIRHFLQVVRRNVGRHAHGNTGGAIEQDVGQSCRKQTGFLQRAVKVGLPVHGALPHFRQQNFGKAGQPGLGVAHGGEGLRVIRGAPVPLPVNQRITVGEGLRHEHHGLVAGRVTVRVVFAQHVTHGPGGFLVLGQCRQAQFGHGIDDSPLYGLEAITDMRQCTVENDVHGIIQVRLFGVFLEREAFCDLVRSGAHSAHSPFVTGHSVKGALYMLRAGVQPCC